MDKKDNFKQEKEKAAVLNCDFFYLFTYEKFLF